MKRGGVGGGGGGGDPAPMGTGGRGEPRSRPAPGSPQRGGVGTAGWGGGGGAHRGDPLPGARGERRRRSAMMEEFRLHGDPAGTARPLSAPGDGPRAALAMPPPKTPPGVRARRADLPGERSCGAGRGPGCGLRCGRDARGAGDSSPGAPGAAERSSAGRAPVGRAGSGCRDRRCRDSGGSEALTYSRGSIAAAALGAVRAAPGFMNEPEPPPRGAGVTWGRGCPEPACTGAARAGPARTPAPPAPRPRMAAPPTGPARPAAPRSPGPERRAAPARPAAPPPPPPAARAGHGADPTVNAAGKQPGGARDYSSRAPPRPR